MKELFACKNKDLKCDLDSFDKLRACVDTSDEKNAFLEDQLIKLALLRTQSDFKKAKEMSEGNDFKFHELDTLTMIEGVSN